ncbi:hypothetical protein H696_03946 [Fonticula alba]|uniref:MAPEG family protein n=1 Tax=Fonticula alba TaxID=691883 RepID=A0A058Z5K9_FONAL|nr:hypothetical protein H696_03946 [Fonticula alba]KCV69525.1 hypothetical protein H696_03946 [Fonticula alba]|eukprot:XP_009496090.1 hypothetical protein H696_03946 [Fonticula alba]
MGLFSALAFVTFFSGFMLTSLSLVVYIVRQNFIALHVIPCLLSTFHIKEETIPILVLGLAWGLTLATFLSCKIFTFLCNQPISSSAPRAIKLKHNTVAFRLQSAHENALEALPALTAAIVASGLAGVDAHVRNTLLVLFILLRVSHWISYGMNIFAIRGFSYMMGNACLFLLFAMSISPSCTQNLIATLNSTVVTYVDVAATAIATHSRPLASKVITAAKPVVDQAVAYVRPFVDQAAEALSGKA